MTFELRAIDAKEATICKDPLKNFFFHPKKLQVQNPTQGYTRPVITDYLLLCSLGLPVEPHFPNTKCETWPQQNIRIWVEVGRIEDWDVSLILSPAEFSITLLLKFFVCTWSRGKCKTKQNRNQRDRKIKKGSGEKDFTERDSQSLARGPLLLLVGLRGRGDTAKIVFNILCVCFSVTRIHSFHQLFLGFYTLECEEPQL